MKGATHCARWARAVSRGTPALRQSKYKRSLGSILEGIVVTSSDKITSKIQLL
jgi:hypothetical protein